MGFGPILFRTCLKGQKEITVAAYSHKVEGSCDGLEIYSGFIEAMAVSGMSGARGSLHGQLELEYEYETGTAVSESSL